VAVRGFFCLKLLIALENTLRKLTNLPDYAFAPYFEQNVNSQAKGLIPMLAHGFDDWA
jgi:hypothetical protein